MVLVAVAQRFGDSPLRARPGFNGQEVASHEIDSLASIEAHDSCTSVHEKRDGTIIVVTERRIVAFPDVLGGNFTFGVGGSFTTFEGSRIQQTIGESSHVDVLSDGAMIGYRLWWKWFAPENQIRCLLRDHEHTRVNVGARNSRDD